ncbi:uncharacterized protein LOC129317475 [Prosopis cineraria]|uniref:uncharacterized protein LOC129317475 n=1 Tax=Prosopis cineraria TaxID=364024 RepID=UPI00240F000E|nr:uncharacterized protein LOC129317475 [Prosopis cineraria]
MTYHEGGKLSAASMEFLSVSLCFVLFLFIIQSVTSQKPTIKENAIYPPRGWNSYAAYGWIINEDDFMKNAGELSSRLLDHGYEVATVGPFWHRNVDDGSDSVDEWGRPFPDPKRWPSSVNGVGFKDVAQRVHRLGLKFGIHKKPYFELHTWRAGEIYTVPCSYEFNFLHVNTSLGAGKAYMHSLIQLFVDWGVDYVKLDCVFGESFDLGTITTVSEIMKTLDEPMILSVSPGDKATVEMSKQINGLVNMYRVGPNSLDQWPLVRDHYFDLARDYAAARLIGVDGLRGNSWPDLDMLPFGRLTDPEKKEGPQRLSQLTIDEQKTQMTLWSMAKSPIMFGGDLVRLPLETFILLIHPVLTEISFYSSNNMEFVNKPDTNLRAWVATGRNPGRVYVALFNPHDLARSTSVSLPYIGTIVQGHPFRDCKGRDIWNDDSTVANGFASTQLRIHGCSLFVLDCN